MSPNDENEKLKSQAKYAGFITSFLYLALFFPSFYILLLMPHLYENANITTSIGLIIIALSVSVPLSIVIGIGGTWYMYLQENYKSSLLFCFLPCLVALAVLIVMTFIEKMFL